LARVGAEGLDVAPLAFGIERVEHQAGLARAAGARDHRHLAGADVEVEVLQVVLAGTADADAAAAVAVALVAAVHGPPGRRPEILETHATTPRLGGCDGSMSSQTLFVTNLIDAGPARGSGAPSTPCRTCPA